MVEIDCHKCPMLHLCSIRFHQSNNACPLLELLIRQDILAEPEVGYASKTYRKIYQERKGA